MKAKLLPLLPRQSCSLFKNLRPFLGSRPIAEIEAPELVAMVKAIEQRGARDIAKCALETTGQIFRFAIAHGYAKRKPASEIRSRDVLKAGKRENYPRVSSRELGALLQQIEVYQGTHVTRLAMKLMALTFAQSDAATRKALPFSSSASGPKRHRMARLNTPEWWYTSMDESDPKLHLRLA